MHIFLHNMSDGSIIAVTIMDRMIPGRAEAASQSFVDELNESVWSDGEDSLRALEELSRIATGGHQEAKALRAAEERVRGGIPKNAWSETDQKLMEKGEKPKSHPEHPNV